MTADLGYHHRYEPPLDPHRSAATLLLLHGTGGDEDDLIPLVRDAAPSVAILSPRGNVLENGAPRFFRRLAEGVFDLEDVRRRSAELAHFVTAAAETYGFDPRAVIAVGFSNGANIAAVTMLLHPPVLSAAACIRAMVVTIPEPLPNLEGKQVLISAGDFDPIVPHDHVETLAEAFERAGASVRLRWQKATHGLVPGDIADVRQWIHERLSAMPA